MGKVTPNLLVTNSLIVASSPGSCFPNWLHGKPNTTNPLDLYFWYKASRSLYWGVKPHFEATFTTKATLPSKSPRSTSFPSMSFAENVHRLSWLEAKTPLALLTALSAKDWNNSGRVVLFSPTLFLSWLILTCERILLPLPPQDECHDGDKEVLGKKPKLLRAARPFMATPTRADSSIEQQ